jgi:hypothetical protein
MTDPMLSSHHIDMNSQSLSRQPSLWTLLPSPSLATQYITSRQQLLAPPTKLRELQKFGIVMKVYLVEDDSSKSCG